MWALLVAVATGAAMMTGAALPALAANADHPYENVNKANDKGNGTGDSRVEDLNKAQLNENQKAPTAPPPVPAPAK